MTLGDRPSLGDAWQRDGAEGRQAEVVGGSEGKVAIELERLDAVGTELQVTRGHAVFGLSSQWLQVQGLDGAGEARWFRWVGVGFGFECVGHQVTRRRSIANQRMSEGVRDGSRQSLVVVEENDSSRRTACSWPGMQPIAPQPIAKC